MGTAQRFHDLMGHAWPRMHEIADPRGDQRIDELDVTVTTGGHPLPNAGERFVGRYMFMGGIRCLFDPETGEPAGVTKATALSIMSAVEGGGTVMVTDRRLVGSCMGKSQVANVGFNNGRFLVFSLDYDEVDEFSLKVSSGLLGGRKEKPMMATSLRPGGGIIFEVTDELSERPNRGRFERTRKLKTSRPLFEAAARAGAERRLTPDLTATHRAQLEAVLAGSYDTSDPEEVCALLVDPAKDDDA